MQPAKLAVQLFLIRLNNPLHICTALPSDNSFCCRITKHQQLNQVHVRNHQHFPSCHTVEWWEDQEQASADFLSFGLHNHALATSASNDPVYLAVDTRGQRDKHRSYHVRPVWILPWWPRQERNNSLKHKTRVLLNLTFSFRYFSRISPNKMAFAHVSCVFSLHIPPQCVQIDQLCLRRFYIASPLSQVQSIRQEPPDPRPAYVLSVAIMNLWRPVQTKAEVVHITHLSQHKWY